MSQRHYQVSGRRWFTLDAVELEYDGTKAIFNGSRNIYAPAEYSYRCQSVTNFRWPLLVPRSSKDPANQWRVSFDDFQVRQTCLRQSEPKVLNCGEILRLVIGILWLCSKRDKFNCSAPLQIQGFNVSKGDFSYASDCAGFFSPGIWMGLMTSLLMVLVLTYGLHMIMQLHTMDRFDDPKGPAISVPQNE